ncbi:hypothetical protein [Bordetella genomosp. 5]|uniref:hypothetical protein n=1 Tax=Bordetella genomosp. 5 TaxID=1395608 RepID=UPI000B9DDE1E|nr:hypothetical protein [Bordetella genomosp. 5]
MFDTSYALSVRAIAALGRYQPPATPVDASRADDSRAASARAVERMLAVSAAYFQVPTAH